MRTWWVALVLALCTLCGAQEKRVTVSIPGMSVYGAVSELADKTGEDLKCAPSAAFNSIVVFVRDVPVEDLLAKVAEATGCDWVKTGKTRTLTCTGEAIARMRAKEAAFRRATIARAVNLVPTVGRELTKSEIEDLVAQAESIGKSLEIWIPSEQQRSVLAAIRASTPSTRLVDRVLHAMSVDDLAAVEQGRPVSFCSRPVAGERRLSSTVLTEFEAYKREYAPWRDAVQRSVSAYPVKSGEDPRAFLEEGHGSPAILHVQLDRLPDRPYVRAVVRVADESGALVDSGYELLRLEKVGEPCVLDPDFELTSLLRLRKTQALLSGLDSLATSDGLVPLDRYTKDLVRVADLQEPIGLGTATVLLEISGRTNLNLVACVGDDALSWYARAAGPVPEKWSANAALTEIDSDWQSLVRNKDGWLTLEPKFPYESRLKYFSRDSLASLFQSQKSKRFVSIEEAIQYAGMQPSALACRGYDWQVLLHFMTYGGNVADIRLVHWDNAGPLRILAKLGSGELFRAHEARGVPLADLSLESRRFVTEWLLDSSGVAQWFRSPGSAALGIENLSQLATRVLEQQSLAAIRLRVVERNEPMTFQLRPDVLIKLPFADELENSGYIWQDAQVDAPNVTLQLGTLRIVEVRVELPDGSFVSQTLEQAESPPGDKWIKPRELPADVLEILKKAFDKGGGGKAFDMSGI